MTSKHVSLGHPAYKKPSEDRIIVHQDLNGNKIYSVFDGHSGQGCVTFVSECLPKNIMGRLSLEHEASPERIAEIMMEQFVEMETLCRNQLTYFDGGTTAVMSVVTKTHIITAHIGDSPAIVFTKEGEYLASTVDHDTKNENEIARVEGEGGWFAIHPELGDKRMFGSLAVTRVFGDTIYKIREKGLSAIPEITIWERKPDTYLVVCSDSFTEKEINSLYKTRDSEGELCKVIANHGTHEEICKEVSDALKANQYSLEKTVPSIIEKQTMKFYSHQWGIYCGDNTSIILVEL